MVDAAYMAAKVHEVVPEAEVHATDLNGGGDHWHVAVVSEAFEGKLPLARQRPLLSAFKGDIDTGVVHALDLKCITPAELADRFGGEVPKPFIPHQRGTGDHPGSWD